ncbi:MAG: phosphatase PAP2 family protein [Gemmatimonadaceae bacterium]
MIFRAIRAVLLSVLVSATLAVPMQAQVQDTINKKTPLFVGKDALLLGAFLIGTAVVAPLDVEVATWAQDSVKQSRKFLGRAATGFRLLGDPGSFVTGTVVYLFGRAESNRRIQSLGLHSVESILIADVLGGGIKLLVGRQRPFVDTKNPYNFQLWRGFQDDKYRSFPSGHTITAFAFASTVTRETQFWHPGYAWYVGTVFYGGASLVGLSRIYNNQHWASDVMAGAALGTLVGIKVVKYTHSHPGNHIDQELIKGKKSSPIQISPVLFSIQF